MRLIPTISFLFITLCLPLGGQEKDRGIIGGRIFNSKNNEPVPFVSVVIWGTNIGSITDMDGNFLFSGIKQGFVELRASSIGFETYTSGQILVTNANRVYLDIPLSESSIEHIAEEIKVIIP